MKKKELSLYLHIPFCVKKCLYCDFLSGPAGEGEKQQYVSLLCREIAGWGKMLSEEYEIRTIFMGGGTPSCLLPEHFALIGETVQRHFSCSADMEYTTEANPATVQAEHVRVWRGVGINRVSLGLQSAQKDELLRLGRIHSYEDFLCTYDLLRSGGIENINVDLMADIPDQTVESYEDTLHKVLGLSPEHISSYSLIIEPETEFYEQEQRGLLERASDEADRLMYERTKGLLAEHGYERYEISNYAKAGYACRHNLAYWQCREYLGVGLGASSCLAGCRFCAPVPGEQYKAYVLNIEKADWPQGAEQADGSLCRDDFLVQNGLCEVTPWTGERQMEEFFFLGLRMQQGVSLRDFRERFGRDAREVYGPVFEKYIGQKLLAEDKFHDRIYLTDRGIDVSNVILADFLF